MAENKIFQGAILVSTLFHFVFFLGLPRAPFTPSKRSLEKLKITYYEIKKIPKKEKITKKSMEPIIKKLPKIKKEEILAPPKAATKKETKPATRHVRRTVVTKGEEKKFEAVVEEEKDKAKRATYISYYRAVRERIRERVDANYLRNRNLGEGEIFLSFVVVSSGELIRARVIDERSTSNALLRNIAINSIRDASPFPPFPTGMSQYKITFNIIISFELSK
ncbi:energy transducer TonB [Candidatus Omnitrophota bacterium]